MESGTFVLDFFSNSDRLSISKIFSSYFGIDSEEVYKELIKYDCKDYDEIDFIDKFNIDLLNKYHDKVYITCRHAMTTSDELDYMKKNGLLNLKQMLQGETPLNKFLLENKIKIDVENTNINYDNKTYQILHRDDKCTSCIFDEYKCRSIFNKNEPIYKKCPYRDSLSFLENKLYYDKCETEVFIDGTLKDIYSYDSVRFSPEILNTIEDVIYFIDKKVGSLQRKWGNAPNNKYYILEFDADINSFEHISTNSNYEGYWEISDVIERFGYEYMDYEEGNISPIFYQNLFILKRLLYKFSWGIREQYGQLLPSTVIPPSSIRIVTSHNVNMRVVFDR